MTLARIVRAASVRLIPTRVKAAIRSWLLQVLNKPESDVGSTLNISSFGQFSIAYRRNTADEQVLQHSFDHDIFFDGVPEFQPAEDDVILDIGAHIGTFAVLAASKVPRGKVHAIEACEDTFNFLRVNAALNKLDNLVAHHLALSDREGTCTLYYDSGNWGHSVVSQLSASSEVVSCCSLQQFFEKNGIQKCDFIKFNCEGAEFPILLSSSGNVLTRIGMMLILYHCDLWPNNTPEDLLAYLQSKGFECVVRNRTETRGWIVATNQAWRESRSPASRNQEKGLAEDRAALI